jgi:uncharacterized protein YukE
MSLLGVDPDALRALSHRIARHADSVRGTAQHVRAATAHTPWHGLAGTALRVEMQLAVAAVMGAADGLDDAAAALRRLAGALEQLVDDAVRLARDARHLAGDAGTLAFDTLRHPAHVLDDVAGLGADAVGTAGDLAAGIADVLGL